MMSVITNSYGNVVSSFFGAKFGKHIEELLVSPMPNWVIVAGYVCGGLLRGMMVGLVVTTVALVFIWLHSHHLQVHNIGVVLAAVILTSAVFSLGGLINAIFAKNFDQVNWIPSFVLTPLTYFGGVFYSIDLLPEWARHISMVNPILHMVNAFRYGFLGTSDVSVVGAFALMIAFVIGMFGLAVFLLNRGSGTRD
jgi:ABC-2 type transport system permease protein